jgi:hypothetical protein
MEATEARFACDARQWRDFLDLCGARDETPGTVLRDLIRLHLQRHARRKARSGEAVDERLLGRLRLLVAEALAEAESWGGLQAALARRGLRYAPKGGGLVLADLETGRELCKGSQVGPGYLALARRFGGGYPGHPRPEAVRAG